MAPDALDLRRHRSILFVTGAGISVAAGLPTFRGDSALDRPPGTLDADALPGSLPDLWAFTDEFRRRLDGAEPTAAHRAIAGYPAGSRTCVVCVTTNVDGLHQRASEGVGGGSAVAELHGSMLRTRCSGDCGGEPWPDPAPAGRIPACRRCGGPARPDVTLYGEMPDAEATMTAKRAARSVDLLVVAGASLATSTTDVYLRYALDNGARRVWVNPEPPPDVTRFTDLVLGEADEVLPALLA